MKTGIPSPSSSNVSLNLWNPRGRLCLVLLAFSPEWEPGVGAQSGSPEWEGLLSVNCISVVILKRQVCKSRGSIKSSGQHPRDAMGRSHEKTQLPPAQFLLFSSLDLTNVKPCH